MYSRKLYDLLIDKNVIDSEGKLYFEMYGLKTVVEDSSVIGNVIQEWLKSFMKKYEIPFRTKKNTQEFPDFLMNKDSDSLDLLEVKCFKKSPNFDIANFQAYCRSLLFHPYRLDSDYLIFEYVEHEQCILIKQIWLKKVWEICCGSERSPLKIQWKQGMPVNIRPSTWYSKKATFPSFETRRDFVLAIKKVLDTSSVSQGIQRNWMAKVSKLYKEQTGNDL